MQQFTHKGFIGDFFSVLKAPSLDKESKPSLLLGRTKRKDAVIAILSGSFTGKTLPEFASTLYSLLTSIARVIVLDFSRVNAFSADAAGVLVNFLAAVEGMEKQLVIYRPNDIALKMLTSLDLLNFFEIQQTSEDLLLDLPD
ncbi:hypothetical protein FACS1894206_04540 [Deltaproteobacteria bacterium]|nr:hypothetical protein FACS1894206_04540 [Deltaproteobacteria bacterium]